MIGSSVGRGWPARTLMGDLSEDIRNEFLRLGAERRFSSGDVIVAENDRRAEVYVILSGFVRVLNHTTTGEQAMIAIRTRGDLIGELAALDGKPRTSTAIATGATRARVVDGPLFRRFAAQHPAFKDAVARSIVAKLRAATRYRTETGQASVLTRVARVLEHLADSYGHAVSGGVVLDIPLPQHDLASLVASSPKGVARAYKRLREAGAIAVSYRRVLVCDITLLQMYASGETESD